MDLVIDPWIKTLGKIIPVNDSFLWENNSRFLLVQKLSLLSLNGPKCQVFSNIAFNVQITIKIYNVHYLVAVALIGP